MAETATPPTQQLQNEDLPSRDYLLLALLGVTSRAQPLAFDFLTARDRMQLPLVSKTCQHHLAQIEYSRCKDGRLYKVAYPGFPGLLESSARPSESSKPNQESNLEGLFPHQLASLRAMHLAENSETHYGALRGGILADAPGLGKTITMLGLITSTAGTRPRAPREFWDPEQIAEGWQALTQNPGCRHDIAMTIKPFRHLPVVFSGVTPPFSPDRFPRLRDFDLYVRRTVKEYATEAEVEVFRQNLLRLQAGLHKSHRKVLKSEAGRRMAWERNLMPTSATLLVVPDALLEHWFQQIHQHLNRSLFADDKEGTDHWGDSGGSGNANEKTNNNENARGVVYLDGVGDIADARLPLGAVNVNSPPIIPPWELSKYLIVVTTFSRCEREYQRQGLRHAGKRKHFDTEEDRNKVTISQPSSLLQMRWLRIVVDEGHELGSHEGGNAVTKFIHQLSAERRWVLSGTPTTGDEDDKEFSSKALDQLQRLLLFLRHPVYGAMPDSDDAAVAPSPYVHTVRAASKQKKNGGKEQKQKAKAVWTTKVKDPFLEKKEEGRRALLQVLKSVMVMHRKEDINLPEPIFRQIEVDVPIPDDVQKNIQQHEESAEFLLSQYLRTDDFQSLVDKAQGEYILQAIGRSKQALQERGGALKVEDQASMSMLAGEEMNGNSTVSRKDRRPIKAVVYSSNKFNLRDVSEALYHKLEMENIAEAYDEHGYDCNADLSRFRHNRKEFRPCPICDYQNDYEGTTHTLRRGGEPKCHNSLLEVVKKDDPAVRFLVEPERVVRAIAVGLGGNVTADRMNGLPYTKYGSSRRRWRVGDILAVDIQDPHPLLKKRESIESWQEYGSEKCSQLAQDNQYLGKDWFFGPLPTSENANGGGGEDDDDDGMDPRRTMEVVLSKWQPCSRYHNTSRWYRGSTLAQVPLQTRQENVFILALDAGLAHGLDLSFVTHIFLLESIDDAALLEQITSRAHRLGSTGPVTVTTVDPYYKLDKKTEQVLERSTDNQNNNRKKRDPGSSKSSNTKRSSLKDVVCKHCYRKFDTMAAAEDHEEKQCPRNPSNVDVVDPWHLSSVYREIRPPPSRVPSTPHLVKVDSPEEPRYCSFAGSLS